MKRGVKFHFFKQERGAILIITGAGLLAFLGLCSLTVDLGHIFVTRAELQNAADSATLAAVAELNNSQEEALQEALDFGQAHRVAGAPILIDSNDVLFGYYDAVSGAFEVDGSPVNAVQVTARRTEGSLSGPLSLFFARLFGKDTSNVRATALAVADSSVIGVQAYGGLIPLVAKDTVVGSYDENGILNFYLGSIIDIYPRKDAPGNFWYLDLDGGSNSNQDLDDWIRDGYDEDFIIPPGETVGVYGAIEVEGTPGIRGESLEAAYESIMGKVIFMPVHNSLTGEGANAIYNVITLLAARISEVNLDGAEDERYVRAELIYTTSSALVSGPNAPPSNSVAKPRLVL